MTRRTRDPGPLHPVRPDEVGRPEPLAPSALGRDEQLELYRRMLLARGAVRRLAGPAGGARPGFEAVAAGTGWLLAPGDLVAPPPREPGVALARGLEVSAALSGVGDPLARGLYTALPAAEALPVVAGLALAARARGESGVVVAHLGADEAWSGAVHEGLTTAALHALPLLLVVECHRGPAVSAPRQGPLASAVARGATYGVPAESVDGGDVLAVVDAAGRALERARSGRGPGLLEARVPRPGVGEEGGWLESDPVARFAHHLSVRGLADDDQLAAHLAAVEAELDAAFALAAGGRG